MAIIDTQYDGRKVLYLPVGIPGSGKSTYIKDFCRINRVISLCPDTLRGVVGKDESDQSVNGKVFGLMEVMVRYFMREEKSIIIDATNYSVKNRSLFVSLAREHGYHVRAFCFDTPLSVCKARNAARSRVVPEDVLERMQKGLVWPLIGSEVDTRVFVT